jgi:hypothetical protein
MLTHTAVQDTYSLPNRPDPTLRMNPNLSADRQQKYRGATLGSIASLENTSFDI